MNNETIARKLDEARALIERGWCQKAFARAGDGSKVKVCHGDAVSFCSMGALDRVGAWASGPINALEAAVGVTVVADVMDWNDAPERTQAEVLDAFKRAAELARSSSLTSEARI
ncbi:MAG: hypothetical protein JWR80_9526 [Bradyrhizobium sp.]|nr:hypothetical protein [Bradyrhizobium sp.]